MSSQASNEMRQFGKKLRALRVHKGLTLKDMTVLLGHTAHGYISELESGKKMPTAYLVLQLSRFFHVTTDALLKDEIELECQKSS